MRLIKIYIVMLLLSLSAILIFATDTYAGTIAQDAAESVGYSAEQIAFAQYICKIRSCFLTNRLLLTICTIAVSILAIMVIFGKANWNMVLVTLIGTLVVTGAYGILSSIGILGVGIDLGFTIPTANSSAGITISTTDPCVAVGCFNLLEIGKNIIP
jgi:type IV secretory pathway VirB2 component (pilin)